MLNNHYIIYAVIIIGVFTAYMAILNLLRGDRMRNRVRGAAIPSLPEADRDEDESSALAAFCERAVRLTGVNPGAQKELTLLLAQAGITSPHAVAYYLFAKRIVQPVLFVIGGWFFIKMMAFSAGVPMLSKLLNLLVALLLLVTGLFGASLYINNRKQRRQAILLRSFPEVLDLLLVCIESGLGLDAALARTCQEMQMSHPVVTAELDRVRLELTLMSDRVQALQNLADRTEILPYKALVSALIQTEKFGTSLVDTLRVLSDDQRTTRLLNAENKAARIPVLITIPLILCILPSFIMIILGPPIVHVIQQGGIFGPSMSENSRIHHQ